MAIEHDEPEPPPKVYGFKEREFKRDNADATGQPAMPTTKELAMMASPATGKPPPGAKAGGADRTADPNDPYKLLQQNRAVEMKTGFDEIEIRKIRYRRTRDFWVTLIGGNLFIVGLVTFVGYNAVTLIYGLAGVIMFTIGLSWIMWQIMSKY